MHFSVKPHKDAKMVLFQCNSDTDSNMTDSRQGNHLVRLMPTYRLEPIRKFNKEKCEQMMKTVIDASLDEFEYESTAAATMATTLSDAILCRVKKFNFDRFKFVCNVTLVENSMQGFCAMYRCLWDKKFDKTAIYIYETPHLYAIATVHGLYFD